MIRLISQGYARMRDGMDFITEINYENYDIWTKYEPRYTPGGEQGEYVIAATQPGWDPKDEDEVIVLAVYKDGETVTKVLDDMRNTLCRKHNDLEVVYYTFPEDHS